MQQFVTLSKRTIRLPQIATDDGIGCALNRPFRYPVEATLHQDAIREAMLAAIPKEHRKSSRRHYGPSEPVVTRGNRKRIERRRRVTDQIVALCDDWMRLADIGERVQLSKSSIKRHLTIAQQEGRIRHQERKNVFFYKRVSK